MVSVTVRSHHPRSWKRPRAQESRQVSLRCWRLARQVPGARLACERVTERPDAHGTRFWKHWEVHRADEAPCGVAAHG